MIRSEKTCWSCKRVLPISCFHLNRTKLDGHSDECRECKSTYLRERAQRIAADNLKRRESQAVA